MGRVMEVSFRVGRAASSCQAGKSGVSECRSGVRMGWQKEGDGCQKDKAAVARVRCGCGAGAVLVRVKHVSM